MSNSLRQCNPEHQDALLALLRRRPAILKGMRAVRAMQHHFWPSRASKDLRPGFVLDFLVPTEL